jgi:tryptophanyl-tRNA synthetase
VVGATDDEAPRCRGSVSRHFAGHRPHSSMFFTLRRATIVRRTVHSLRCNSTSSKPNAPKVVFSGIQPTGVPHLGNYLGALRQWRKLQDEAAPDDTLLYSIVDLHAITIKQDPARLRQWRKEMLASLYAVGLDPDRATIFCQSAVPQHAELMWILSCNASMGYLSRMTQWKVAGLTIHHVTCLDAHNS